MVRTAIPTRTYETVWEGKSPAFSNSSMAKGVFEGAVMLEEYVVEVDVFPDGTMVDADGNVFRMDGERGRLIDD